MKSFEPVTLFDGIERTVNEFKLEDSVAGHVIAGCPVDADARQVDRSRLRHFRKTVRDPHDIVSIDILGLRRITPSPGFPV
jgi:hypothetical protein